MSEKRDKLLRITEDSKILFDKLKQEYMDVYGPATQTLFLKVLMNNHSKYLKISGK